MRADVNQAEHACVCVCAPMTVLQQRKGTVGARTRCMLGQPF